VVTAIIVNTDIANFFVYQPAKVSTLACIGLIKTSAAFILIMQKLEERVSIRHFVEEILWVQITFTVAILICVAAADLFAGEE
jgi:Na+/H+ antiporter NhaD/arsenite permease-like protein